jgi:hypothetical protein
LIALCCAAAVLSPLGFAKANLGFIGLGARLHSPLAYLPCLGYPRVQVYLRALVFSTKRHLLSFSFKEEKVTK